MLPLYNPGDTLHTTLQALAGFVDSVTAQWEIVFVADGCTDGSVQEIENWIRDRDDVQLIQYAPNCGKGHAVRRGLLAAKGAYRIFTDIDLAYNFDDIQRVAWCLRRGDHVVIGSRGHAESTIQLSPQALGYAWLRQQQSRVFARVVRLMLPIIQRDTQAGLKGFSEQFVSLVIPKLTCEGFGFDCELSTACVRMGFSITEVPVHVRCDLHRSTTNPRATLRMLKDIWRIRQQWPATVSPSARQSSLKEAA